ncbi:MAG: MATE family efflux transporter [Lachnospiraceae bacterium]|nr:MATE family efflux transporter [Lachnospiraceae bacterium]
MAKDEIRLSDHFTVKRLIRFTFVPTMALLVTSLYSIVDSWFIANYTDTTAFAAVILMMPYVLTFPAVGFMIGGGGNALISKVLGEGDEEGAGRVLSMMMELCFLAGLVMTALGQLLLKPFLFLLKTDGRLLECSLTYGRIMLCGVTLVSLMYVFQLFLITAEKQTLAFLVTLSAGITNIILDALLIIVFDMGLRGAAIASVTGQTVGTVIPLIYFLVNKNAALHFRLTALKASVCLKSCGNGVSEMIENIAEGFVGMLYNYQLLRFAGEAGVDAYGAVHVTFTVFTLLFVGFNEAAIPVVGFHYGSGNRAELKNLFRIWGRIMLTLSAGMFVLVEFLAPLLADLFVEKGTDLMDMTIRGFRICGISLLFLGINYFATSFFTALNNGLVSGIISLLVMLVFPFVTVMGLPAFLDIDGIWASLAVTGLLGTLSSCIAFARERKRYGY